MTSPQNPSIHIKALPAVPAGAFLALSGFLCVSLVKDRKVWLASLAGLLWVSQAGIQALPQLTLRLIHRNHNNQMYSAELACPYSPEHSGRLRSDVEGTQYIGLLHHLAGIPRPQSALNFTQPDRINAQAFCRLAGRKVCAFARYSHKQPLPHLSAIIPGQYSLNSQLNCSVAKAEQFIRFSPAFIFERLARGPPLFT